MVLVVIHGPVRTWLPLLHPGKQQMVSPGAMCASECLSFYFLPFLGLKSIHLAVTAFICMCFIIENSQLCISPMQSGGFKAAGGNRANISAAEVKI